MKRLLKAVRFAAEKHADGRRKNAAKTPYINHPVEVAELLARVGKVRDTDTIIAALLHDTIEDTDTSEEEIRREFGDTVADIVLEVTDDKRLPRDDRKRLHIERAATASKPAKRVKLADKICNMRDMLKSPPCHWPLERQRAYFDWAYAVFQNVKGINRALDREFLRIYEEGVREFDRRLGERAPDPRPAKQPQRRPATAARKRRTSKP